MRDGNYELRFSADGYSSRGQAQVDGARLVGHDDQYRFEGSVTDGKAHVTSLLNVAVKPGFVHNTHVPPQFSLQLTGTWSDNAFSLIGTGPLGMIVEIDGVRRSAGSAH